MFYLKYLYRLYKEGFAEMREGKLLWKIALLKIFVMFFVIKVFFYPAAPHKALPTAEQKANYFLKQYGRDLAQPPVSVGDFSH